MRVAVLSDIHLEFADFTPPGIDADLVVLAGDIHVGSRGLPWATNQFRCPVVYIPGNHEYYGKALPKHTRAMKEAVKGTNVTVLENGKVEVEGWNILGCTLWTDFKLFGDPRIAGYEATQKMTDYRKIRVSPEYRKLRSRDTAGENHKSVTWLTAELAKLERSRTIVVTHHAPSPLSLSSSQRSDLLSAAYASELSGLVEESKVPLWIHGHLHSSSDYLIGRTRVVCNPRGYPDELNPDFVPDLVIEL